MVTGAAYIRDRMTGSFRISFETGPYRRALGQFLEVWQTEHMDRFALMSGASRYYSETDLSRFDLPFLSVLSCSYAAI